MCTIQVNFAQSRLDQSFRKYLRRTANLKTLKQLRESFRSNLSSSALKTWPTFLWLCTTFSQEISICEQSSKEKNRLKLQRKETTFPEVYPKSYWLSLIIGRVECISYSFTVYQATLSWHLDQLTILWCSALLRCPRRRKWLKIQVSNRTVVHFSDFSLSLSGKRKKVNIFQLELPLHWFGRFFAKPCLSEFVLVANCSCFGFFEKNYFKQDKRCYHVLFRGVHAYCSWWECLKTNESTWKNILNILSMVFQVFQAVVSKQCSSQFPVQANQGKSTEGHSVGF